MGPLDVSRPWETRAVVGSQRFLQRLWRMVVDEHTGATVVVDAEPDDETRKLLHRTIDGVRDRLRGAAFNTAIAKLIELTNHLTKSGRAGAAVGGRAAGADDGAAGPAHRRGAVGAAGPRPIAGATTPFPVADPALLVADAVEYPVQVNGKVRAPSRSPPTPTPTTVEARRAGRRRGSWNCWPAAAAQGHRGARPHGLDRPVSATARQFRGDHGARYAKLPTSRRVSVAAAHDPRSHAASLREKGATCASP